jgi:alkanesulfonate monooxygenase SsuD/methylene tetrahydromethanopterin reductase-like flavin-dependent oxidoreductase (luciferase family)
MTISVILPALPTDAEGRDYIQAAIEVERLGFGGIYCGDHIFGNVATPDALALLASFAVITSRIKIGTAVLLLALREPIVTAKQVATIDQLSSGRLTLGVGVGGEVDAEWAAMGISKSQRGARTDEYLHLMKGLWTGEDVDFNGKFKSLAGVRGTPQPARLGGPPIWIGGRTDAALERALRFDGWCGYAVSPRNVAQRVLWLRERRPEFEISVLVFARIDTTKQRALSAANTVVDRYYHQDWTNIFDSVGAVGTSPYVAERIDAFFAAGATEVILAPMVSSAKELQEQLPLLADSLLPRT